MLYFSLLRITLQIIFYTFFKHLCSIRSSTVLFFQKLNLALALHDLSIPRSHFHPFFTPHHFAFSCFPYFELGENTFHIREGILDELLCRDAAKLQSNERTTKARAVSKVSLQILNNNMSCHGHHILVKCSVVLMYF